MAFTFAGVEKETCDARLSQAAACQKWHDPRKGEHSGLSHNSILFGSSVTIPHDPDMKPGGRGVVSS